MSHIFPLPVPVRPELKVAAAKPQPGYRYRLSLQNRDILALHANPVDFDPQQSGVVGHYWPGLDKSVIAAVDLNRDPVYGYIWDADLPDVALLSPDDADEQSLIRQSNQLTVMDAGLAAPEVRLHQGCPLLSIAPQFELEWCTDGFASQLGLLQLVESSRSLQLEDGESVVLMDSNTRSRDPVLYLEDSGVTQAIKVVCDYQAKGDRQRFRVSRDISQSIPGKVNGKAVVSLSVLEKHVCYFMQNARPDQPVQHVWTPVHLPIVWGWSIRVQQRFDGVWDIFRKKLILPTPCADLPRLPVWQANSL